jgi:transposase
MAYSEDLRERALAFIEETGSINKAIEVFQVSRSAINRWREKKKNGVSLEDPPPKRPWKKIAPDKLLSLVKSNPDWTQAQYASIFNVSAPAISLAFKKLKISRKKSPHSIKKGIPQNGQHIYIRSKESPRRT